MNTDQRTLLTKKEITRINDELKATMERARRAIERSQQMSIRFGTAPEQIANNVGSMRPSGRALIDKVAKAVFAAIPGRAVDSRHSVSADISTTTAGIRRKFDRII